MAISEEQKASTTTLRELSQELANKAHALVALTADAERRVLDDPVKEFTWAEGIAWLTPRLTAAKADIDTAEAAVIAHFNTMAAIP